MYKEMLALNNLLWLIYHKIKRNQISRVQETSTFVDFYSQKAKAIAGI